MGKDTCETTAQARNEVGPKLLQQGPYEDCGDGGGRDHQGNEKLIVVNSNNSLIMANSSNSYNSNSLKSSKDNHPWLVVWNMNFIFHIIYWE